MKPIRELIAIKEGRDDTNYTLVRNEAGKIWVETFRSPNQAFARGGPGPRILADSFDDEEIDGKPLRLLVEEALRRIDGASASEEHR